MTRRVKIPCKRKGDFQIIREKLEEVVQQELTLIDQSPRIFDEEDWVIFRKTAERRFMNMLDSSYHTFQNIVEYSNKKSKSSKVVVIRNPDKNIHNLNEIKMSMLSKMRDKGNLIRQLKRKQELNLKVRREGKLQVWEKGMQVSWIQDFMEEQFKSTKQKIVQQNRQNDVREYELLLMKIAKVVKKADE